MEGKGGQLSPPPSQKKKNIYIYIRKKNFNVVSLWSVGQIVWTLLILPLKLTVRFRHLLIRATVIFSHLIVSIVWPEAEILESKSFLESDYIEGQKCVTAVISN